MSDFLQAAPLVSMGKHAHRQAGGQGHKGTAYSCGGGGGANSFFIFSSEKKAVLDNIVI